MKLNAKQIAEQQERGFVECVKEIAEGWFNPNEMSDAELRSHLRMATGASEPYIVGYCEAARRARSKSVCAWCFPGLLIVDGVEVTHTCCNFHKWRMAFEHMMLCALPPKVPQNPNHALHRTLSRVSQSFWDGVGGGR